MFPIPMTLLKSRTRKQSQGLYTYAALWSYKEMVLRTLDYKEVTNATMNNQLKWVTHSGCWLTPPLWSWVKPNTCLEHMQAPPWQNHIHITTFIHTQLHIQAAHKLLKTIQLQEPIVTKNTEIDDTSHRDWQEMQWKPNWRWRCNTSLHRIFPLTPWSTTNSTFACLSATCNLNELDAGTKLFESNKVIASSLHVNCSLWTLDV
jgi:hypothetical protein